MKKLFGALVKLFSLLAVLGALLYAAVLYWDKIMGRGGQAERHAARPVHRRCGRLRGGGLRRLGDVTASGARLWSHNFCYVITAAFFSPAGLYLPKTDVI